MNMLDQWLYRLKCKCKHRFLCLKCLLIAHDIVWSNYLGDHYCRRCNTKRPFSITLPLLLNRCYCWLMSKEWNWFDKLDIWLCDKCRMPRWWEY